MRRLADGLPLACLLMGLALLTPHGAEPPQRAAQALDRLWSDSHAGVSVCRLADQAAETPAPQGNPAGANSPEAAR